MSQDNGTGGWGEGHPPQPLPSALPGRPSTPAGSSDIEPLPPNLPDTPDSVSSRPRTPGTTEDDTIGFDPPPIPLEKHTWSKPPVIARPRASLRYPTGRPDRRTPAAASWQNVFRTLDTLYKYKTIGPNQVRLILLKPGKTEDDVFVSIVVLHQDQLGNEHYPYIALSYNWGKGDPGSSIWVHDDPTSAPTGSIADVVDATRVRQFKITTNLLEALKTFRHEQKTVAIWIDAICINQLRPEERSIQVAKMNLIYSKAYNVNIWLGSDSEDNNCSDTAMRFIPEAINLHTLDQLLKDETRIKHWASLFELLRWSWFTRRWIIQEVALAQEASVHCGKLKCSWSDFQTAIGIFCQKFDILKPKLKKYFEDTQPEIWPEEFDVQVGSLGAWLLVDMTLTLFRKKSGYRESTKSLEWLVCSLSVFDSTDPRDTINALRNICRELNQPDSSRARSVPAPDYKKDLFQVYREFLQWVINTSESLDILCRSWALKEREETSATYPRIVDLPSYIQFAEDSAWGIAGNCLNGRQAGDSFVGLPGDHIYHASGTGGPYCRPQVQWPSSLNQGSEPAIDEDIMINHDMSLYVRGFAIGAVTFRTDPFADSVITKPCLEGLGWTVNRKATEVPEVPNRVWQTLVADKGPKRQPMPPWYKKACQHVLAKQTNNGHLNIDKILRTTQGRQVEVQAYLTRVKAVTWNRVFIKGNTGQAEDELVGFAPPGTETGDVIAILFGCSVPVILRPNYSVSDPSHVEAYQFVGEAFIYGKMEGEALDDVFDEQMFKLI